MDKPAPAPMPLVMWGVIVLVLILGSFKFDIGTTTSAKAEAYSQSVAQNYDNTRDIQRARAEIGMDSDDSYGNPYRYSEDGASSAGSVRPNNHAEIERTRSGSNDRVDYESENYLKSTNAAAAIGSLTYSYIPWGGLIVVLFFICFGSLLYMLLSKSK